MGGIEGVCWAINEMLLIGTRAVVTSLRTSTPNAAPVREIDIDGPSTAAELKNVADALLDALDTSTVAQDALPFVMKFSNDLRSLIVTLNAPPRSPDMPDTCRAFDFDRTRGFVQSSPLTCVPTSMRVNCIPRTPRSRGRPF